MQRIVLFLNLRKMDRMNRIKEVLDEKNIKQTWLSKNLGKSYNMVNSYAQNRRQPSLETLFEIAELLKVEPKDLIGNKKLQVKLGVKINTSMIKPIQYLGAKDRVLNSILEHSSTFINGGYVLDLFSGSTVVSQAFAKHGANVISNDIQEFSGNLGHTFLKVGYTESDLNIVTTSFRDLPSGFDKFYNSYQKYLDTESICLDNKDTLKLLDNYDRLPLVWKNTPKDNTSIAELFREVNNSTGYSAIGKAPLFTTLYAGTYFGIKQSLEIDQIRWGIEQQKDNNEINNWQYHFLLSALHSTVSKIVNSAGKHFAQPIKPKNILNSELLEGRLYQNRVINVISLFEDRIQTFLKDIRSNIISDKNIVLTQSMEDLIKESKSLSSIDLIYADPPYTAQQYSRFYHIPDILSKYTIPELQIFRGKVTSGIYPDNKFKSRFCSLREAPNAFKDLFNLTKNLDTNLVLSYSESKNIETGNKRMITIHELQKLAREILTEYKMKIINLDLKYKQLNKQNKVNNKSLDSEVLIVFAKKK